MLSVKKKHIAKNRNKTLTSKLQKKTRTDASQIEKIQLYKYLPQDKN